MHRNIVLLVLDSVRKDYFDEYATRLRSNSDLSYEQCRAASSWSTPSHASMMTGQLPSEHGIHGHNVSFSGLQRENTFLTELSEYTARGASTNLFAGTPFGFDGVFDSFSSISRHALFPNGLDIDNFLRENNRDSVGRYWKFLQEILNHEHTTKSFLNGVFLKLNDGLEGLPFPRLYDYGTGTVSREVVNYLGNTRNPKFIFANYMEAHTPLQHTRVYDRSLHNVPLDWSSNEIDIFDINNSEDMLQFEKYLENFRQLHAAAVDYLDQRLISLIDRIQTDTERETTVVVTADHGENLGTEADNKLLGHVSTLTDATLHVPLEVFNPPDKTNERINDYVSHLDLPQLLIGLARGELPEIQREQIPAERIGLGLSHNPDNYEYWNRMLRCVYDNKIKYEWDSLGNSQRYRIDHEQSSSEKLIQSDIKVPDECLELFGSSIDRYKQRAAGDTSENSGMEEHTRSQLEDLGYL